MMPNLPNSMARLQLRLVRLLLPALYLPTMRLTPLCRWGLSLTPKELLDVDAVIVNEDHAALLDILQVLGVPLLHANRCGCSLSRMPEATFMELYGQGRTVQASHGNRRSLNCDGLSAIDHRTLKPDGAAWDLTKPEDRDLAEKPLDETGPGWITGWPPCNPFCSRIVHMNVCKMDPSKVAAIVEEGRQHLRWMIPLYKKRVEKGRFFT